jgi:hypothetical protein
MIPLSWVFGQMAAAADDSAWDLQFTGILFKIWNKKVKGLSM